MSEPHKVPEPKPSVYEQVISKEPRLIETEHLPVTSGLLAFDAGGWHTMIVRADGSEWGAGNNERGQLGDGTREPKTLPLQAMEHIVAVETGYEQTIVLDRDSQLWGFGSNAVGQLGDRTDKTLKVLPVRVFPNE